MALVSGSSPHMRGKLARRRNHGTRKRIIPAHAGQTAPDGMSKPPSPDHPRTCGANPLGRRVGGWRPGSSPHMRGKPSVPGRVELGGRIIPAHAGQTLWSGFTCWWPADHPRTCGANPLMFSTHSLFCGSSPHMRGKLAGVGFMRPRPRIIPAHAGQTNSGRERP